MDVSQIHLFSLSRRLLPVIVLTVLANGSQLSGALATDWRSRCYQRPMGQAAVTWTSSSGGPPAGSDNAYIGSPYPAGSAGTATVTLGGGQSVNYLYLGYGTAASNGTLNLAGNHLTVNSILYFGLNGGSGTIVHNGGYFSTPNLNLYNGNSIVLAASDTVTSALTLSNSSQLTTKPPRPTFPASVNLYGGSTLTLGASMSRSGNPDICDNGSTLNMAGHALAAPTIYLGWYDSQPVTVLNQGPITTPNLNIGNGAFNLGSLDSVTNLSLS